MLKENNDHCEKIKFVAETSSIFNNNSSLIPKSSINLNYSSDFSNSIPIESTFIKFDESTYSILEKKCILNDLSQHKHIIVPSIGIINGINLIDFPVGQYTLSLNGLNLATAKYDFITKKYFFNIASSESESMNIFKSVAIDKDEPNLISRNEYLNLYRVDTIYIIIPKNVKLPKTCTIEMNGYFKEEYVWKNKLATINVYPHDTYNLNISKVTESIDITSDHCGSIMIIIDDMKYTIKIGNTPIRISFDNTEKTYIGEQNKFLPLEINNRTINFSRVNSISFVTLDCKITKLYQNYYESYSYPERNQIFV